MIHCKCCRYTAKTRIEYCEYTANVKEELLTRTFTHVQAKQHPRIGWDDVAQWEVQCWDDMWLKEYAVPGELKLEPRGSRSRSRSRSRRSNRRTQADSRGAAESHAQTVTESEESQNQTEQELRTELKEFATKLFDVCIEMKDHLIGFMNTLNEWNNQTR